jgi:hypothetical protein
LLNQLKASFFIQQFHVADFLYLQKKYSPPLNEYNSALQKNSDVTQRNIWSDEEECGSDVVECTFDEIVELFTVYNSEKKNVPYWK